METEPLSLGMVKPVPKNVKDLTGQVFGDLIMVGFLDVYNYNSFWKSECRDGSS